MTRPDHSRKRRRLDSSVASRQEDGRPKRLELERVPVYSRDKDLVPRLVRVYQTYAGSLSPKEQKDFVNMIQSGDYIRHKGGSIPVRASKHHFYVQMYDSSNALWLREEITFVKWALLATLYPPESLYELGKVIVHLGLDLRPCFSKYARSHKTTLESLELPNPWQLAKQCTATLRIVSVLELRGSTISNYHPTRILRASTPELGPVVTSKPSVTPPIEDVDGVSDHMDVSYHVKDASTNTMQLVATSSEQKLQAEVARLECEVALLGQKVAQLQEIVRKIDMNTAAIESHRHDTTDSLRKLHKDHQDSEMETILQFKNMASQFTQFATRGRARFYSKKKREGDK